MPSRSCSSYTAIAVKLGLLAALAGLGACSSVQTSASLTHASPRQYAPAAPTQSDTGTPALSTALASDAMPYGGRTAAPMGFLEMCTRSPIDCTHSTDFQPERIRTIARADVVQAYRIAFSGGNTESGSGLRAAAISNDRHRGQSPSAIANDATDSTESVAVDAGDATRAQATSDVVLTPMPQIGEWKIGLGLVDAPGAIAYSSPSPRLLTWGAKAAPAIVREADVMTVNVPDLPSALPALPNEPVSEVASDGDIDAGYERIDMDMSVLALLRTVNNQVNDMMRPSTDERTYGVEDYWNDPALVYGVRGDCEDFALEKRRLLIDRGVPAAALSIAIVRTRRDEEHAVLVVTSKAGDYVLDNLAADVKPWRRSGYTWISRQGPGDDLTWVSLAPANQSSAIRAVYVANAW